MKTMQQEKRVPTGTHPKAENDAALWSALNDTSRRNMLDLLRQKSMTTNELCAHFVFSRFAVMKHLKALEKANLILIERRGRDRINHLNPVPLQEIYNRWIRNFEKLPSERLLRVRDLAEYTMEQ